MILAGRNNIVVREITRLIYKAYYALQTYRVVLLRAAVTLAVLVLTPLLGILIVDKNPILIIVATVAPLGLVGVQLVLKRAHLGPIAILGTACFLPLYVSTGTQTPLMASLLLTLMLVGIWVLRMLVGEKRLWLHPSPVNKPLLAFMGSVVFATIWSVVFRDPLVDPFLLSNKFVFVQIATALTMLLLPGAFLLVANTITDLKLLKLMLGIMMVAGFVGLARQIGFDIPVNTGGMFTMWATTIAVGLVLFNRRLTWWQRIILAFIALAWFYFRFFRSITWLAGWLPSMLAIIVLTFMRSKKLFFFLAIVGIIVVAINSSYYLGTVIEDETAESGNTRLAAWEVNWRVTGKHLIFGTGPAGYAAYYMSYFPDEAMASHNNIVDITAQTGVVGLVLCLWFFVTMARESYKLSRDFAGRGDFAEALANIGLAGTIACILALFIGDWLFPFPYTQTLAGFDYIVYSWLFMGTIPALRRLATPDSEVVEHA